MEEVERKKLGKNLNERTVKKEKDTGEEWNVNGQRKKKGKRTEGKCL